MPATRNRYRLSGAVAVTFAVAVAVSPATLAHANASATVSPGSVAPGGRVSLNLVGCATNSGRAISNAFGEVRLNPGNLQSRNLFGSATVFTNASPGSHPVTFECGGPGGERVTVSLNVSSGAARGGLGGSMDTVSPAEVAVGGTLVASALGAGVWVLRRRSRPAR